MLSDSERRKQAISIRLSKRDIATIDRAAALRGRSRTDFVRDAAICEAETVLVENQLIGMNADGFAHFTAQLAGPAEPVPEIVELLNCPAPWDAGYASKR